MAQWVRWARRAFHTLVALAFLFLALAGVWVSAAEWRYYLEAPSAGLWRFGLLAGFTVILFVLCLYSFVKARSVGYRDKGQGRQKDEV